MDEPWRAPLSESARTWQNAFREMARTAIRSDGEVLRTTTALNPLFLGNLRHALHSCHHLVPIIAALYKRRPFRRSMTDDRPAAAEIQ